MYLYVLKKYIYGKYIVVCVEKLVVVGGEYVVVIGEWVIMCVYVE